MKLAKAEAVYRPNILINGDFQVWPRGEIFSNIANQYTAAMWKLENANTQVSVVEKSSDIPEGVDCNYSIHIKDTGTLANIYFSQYLKNGLKGKYVLSFWYKSTSKMNSYIYDNGSAQLFMSENTNGIWKYKMLKINATNLTRICLIQDGCNGDFYLASVRLYSGEVDFNHIEEDEATALIRSQQYVYNVLNGESTYGFVADGYIVNSNLVRVFVDVPVQMKGTPTLTTSGTFEITNGDGGFSSEVSVFSVNNLFCSTNNISINIGGATGLPSTGYVVLRCNNNANGSFVLSCEP